MLILKQISRFFHNLEFEKKKNYEQGLHFSVKNHVNLFCKVSHQVCIMTLLQHSGRFLESLLQLLLKLPSLLDSLIH